MSYNSAANTLSDHITGSELNIMNFPQHLIDGYQNFVSGRLPEQRKIARELAEKGQKPDTMIIACCDSRAAPEMIFGADPGEMFVVRNVANLVPPYEPDGEYHSTSAALEFAVQSLKVKHIVIMGHGRCGGISAALAEDMEPLSAGDFIGKWVSLLAPTAAAVSANGDMTVAERQTALERISIRNSIKNLKTFPFVDSLHSEGKLTVHGAWFDISTGELWTMDDTGDFIRQDGAFS
jgi:carbonic anhydrase